MAHLNDLVEEASTINSSITGVEYNNDHDHEAAGDYDATNRISHVTFISTNHLIKITIQILEKY